MSKPRILLVDDSALLLDVARDALVAAGYDVTTTRDLSGVEPLDEGAAFDLILMDVQMPELFGDDVASVLRHVRGVKSTIYLLSNLDGAELAERVADAGLDGYICKRDGMTRMVQRVGEILEARAGT